jgi:hypothetical protein
MVQASSRRCGDERGAEASAFSRGARSPGSRDASRITGTWRALDADRDQPDGLAAVEPLMQQPQLGCTGRELQEAECGT